MGTVRNRLHDRPISVSYTAWRRWSECPLQERLLREGVPRTVKPKRDYLVGNVMHDLLEDVVRTHRAPDPQAVVHAYEHAASQKGVNFKSPSDRRDLADRTIKATDQLVPFTLGLIDAADDAKAELELGALIRFAPDAPECFYMTAKYDLALSWRDGEVDRYAVLDYKSGSQDLRQMYWFAAVWKNAMPEAFPTTDFYFVSPDAKGSRPKRRKVDIEDRNIASALHDATVLASALRDLDLPPNPEVWKCQRCRVRVSCPASAQPVGRGRTTTDLSTP